jgi:predicted small lipoprotein YifL
MRRLLLLMALTAALAACGQKGDLVKPTPSPTGYSHAA